MRGVVIGVLVGFALCQLGTLVTTVYLHRAQPLAPATTLGFRVLTWLVAGIRPRQWIAVHRKHHAFTDVDGDPHSPLLEGFATVQFAQLLERCGWASVRHHTPSLKRPTPA